MPRLGHRPWPLCGVTTRLPFRDGTIMVCCTRFRGHLTKGKKEPLKHFDEIRKQSWTDGSSEPCPPEPE